MNSLNKLPHKYQSDSAKNKNFIDNNYLQTKNFIYMTIFGKQETMYNQILLS